MDFIKFGDLPYESFFEIIGDKNVYKKLKYPNYINAIGIWGGSKKILSSDDLVIPAASPIAIGQLKNDTYFKTPDGDIYKKINEDENPKGYNVFNYEDLSYHRMSEEREVFPIHLTLVYEYGV